MRFENHSSDATSSVAVAGNADDSACLARPSVPDSGAPRQTGPIQKRLDPDVWWSAVPAALSWLLTQLIEGFACYGESLHPELSTRVADDATARRASIKPPVQVPNVRPSATPSPGEAYQSSNARQSTDVRGWRHRIASQIVACWSGARREHDATSATAALASPDDRTSRDIGASRSRMEPIAGYREGR
jgi:hypothetical protein